MGSLAPAEIFSRRTRPSARRLVGAGLAVDEIGKDFIEVRVGGHGAGRSVLHSEILLWTFGFGPMPQLHILLTTIIHQPRFLSTIFSRLKNYSILDVA